MLNTVSDTPQNRSISYILTWYHSSSITDDDGFAIQCAVWKYATGTDPTGTCSISKSLASYIYGNASGKDVARPGDTLTLTPNNTAVPVGVPQVITAKVANALGQADQALRSCSQRTSAYWTR